jgi:hypothetical protein
MNHFPPHVSNPLKILTFVLVAFNFGQPNSQVVYPSIHVVASVLAWASAVVNPFVYAVTNRQYRSAYRKLFCGSRTRRDASHRPHDHDKSNSSKTYITEFQYHASTAQVTSTPLQQRQAANNKPLI